jgi:hypothetical protein
MFYNIGSRTQCYSTFYVFNLQIFKIYYPWQVFSSLAYCLRVRQKPISVKHLLGSQLIGRLFDLLAYIMLSWEGLADTNTLAYKGHS